MEFINKIRKIQTWISVIIFISVFLFCWWTTSFNIFEIQLSCWGIQSSLSTYWNGTIMGIAISLFFNVDFYVKNHIRMINKRLIRFLFSGVFLLLFLTGFINMNYYLHTITAELYFFCLPFVIFIMAYLNKKTIQYKEWLSNIIFSSCMIVLPLIFLHSFNGPAISEILHSCVVIFWSIWILKKELQ